jgi:hypothetical protein
MHGQYLKMSHYCHFSFQPYFTKAAEKTFLNKLRTGSVKMDQLFQVTEISI